MSALRQARSNSLLLSWYRFRVKQLVCDTDNMASGVWRYMFPARIGQGRSVSVWSIHGLVILKDTLDSISVSCSVQKVLF